jgi:hypothetical protein
MFKYQIDYREKEKEEKIIYNFYVKLMVILFMNIKFIEI